MGFPQVGQTIYGGWSQRGEGYADLDTRFSSYNTKLSGLACDGATDDFAKLNTLVGTTMQGAGGTLDVVGVVRVGTSMAIPSNVRVNFVGGAYFAPDVGVVLTIAGPLQNTALEKRFGGGGTISFGTKPKVAEAFVEWWGGVADWTAPGVGTDNTTAFQSMIDACAHDNVALGIGVKARMLAGNYRITGKLRLKVAMFCMAGVGKYESIIHYEGVAAGCIVSDAITYNNLRFEHFGIVGDAASGRGIDLTATTSQSYNSVFRELYIVAGQQAIHIPNCFSTVFDSVFGSSINNHAFQVLCGPAVSWINCYAGQCGAGKAGYRLTGGIRMYSCNGVNSGDYWGIFGNDTAGTDGFQNDFPTLSYPDVVLEGCNVEAFNVTGIYLQAPYIKFEMRGGDFTRALAGTYHSLLRVVRGSNGVGDYVLLDSVRALISGGASTASPIYSDGADFLVVKGAMSLLGGITGMYCVVFAAIRPAINEIAINDDYQQTALQVSALQSGRLTAQNSLNLGGAGGIGGLNGAPAVSSGKFIKRVTAIADNVATTILTATIFNLAQSAMIRITLVGSLGAGGAIGANEASGSVSYDIVIARTPGLNAVAAITAAIAGAVSSVAGGATVTVTAALAAVTGAAGASNALQIKVTIARGSGASTNHTCLVIAEVINANAQGVTIA